MWLDEFVSVIYDNSRIQSYIYAEELDAGSEASLTIRDKNVFESRWRRAPTVGNPGLVGLGAQGGDTLNSP